MRAFSILATVTALALALSASAAPQNKRAIGNNVQTCINGLTSSHVKLLELTDAINVFTRAAGYAGFNELHKKDLALEAVFKVATQDCCAITTTFSDEEATAVFNMVAEHIPDITNAFDVTISKKPEFDAILVLGKSVTKTDIKSVSGYLKQVDSCLIAVTPQHLLSDVQAHIDIIDSKIIETFAVYNITS